MSPKSSFSDVDAAVRRAILLCWQNLPKEKRNTDDLTNEVLRIAKRALENFVEDIAAFGAGLTDEDQAVRLRPERAGLAWSAEDDEELRTRFRAGETAASISEYFHRSRGSIRSRLVKLGLVADESERI